MAIDDDSGEEVWSQTFEGRRVSNPIVVDRSIIVIVDVGTRSRIVSIRRTRGTVQWERSIEISDGGYPTAANGRIYVASPDGRLEAFDHSDGTRHWTASIETVTHSQLFVPAVESDTLYVPTVDSVFAFETSTGDHRWAFSPDGRIATSPAVARGRVYCGTAEGRVLAIDAKAGEEAWHASYGGVDVLSRLPNAPAIDAEHVYLGGDDGVLHAFDRRTGGRRWRARTERGIYAAPAVSDESVFVTDWDSIYAFEKGGGTRRWNVIDPGPAITADTPPLIADDSLYVQNGAIQKFSVTE